MKLEYQRKPKWKENQKSEADNSVRHLAKLFNILGYLEK